MVLLASGGHCILGIVEDVDKFYRLGETKDIAPGEAFDKVSPVRWRRFEGRLVEIECPSDETA
jgi:tRNA A37 threonylcarbamoyltransferase TsaD